jgi:hypothetical protein
MILINPPLKWLIISKICGASARSVLSLMQLTLMEFWREKCVLRLYPIEGKSMESLISWNSFLAKNVTYIAYYFVCVWSMATSKLHVP